MKLESLPETVQAIIAQAGGLGLRGAFVCIGASAFSYRCAEAVGECAGRSGLTSILVRTGYAGADARFAAAPDFTFDTLTAAADFILARNG